MTSITAPLLEIAVLVLGMLILMIEAFAGKIDKRVLAYAAITGLALVLLASFFVAPFPSPFHATGFWSFYTADRLAIFFKQFLSRAPKYFNEFIADNFSFLFGVGHAFERA